MGNDDVTARKRPKFRPYLLRGLGWGASTVVGASLSITLGAGLRHADSWGHIFHRLLVPAFFISLPLGLIAGGLGGVMTCLSAREAYDAQVAQDELTKKKETRRKEAT